MTDLQRYLDAGYKLMPSGRPNNYQMQQVLGRLGSAKDSTWVPGEPRYKGHHSCCGSKRSYYHKRGCSSADDAALGPDDLSDLKDA